MRKYSPLPLIALLLLSHLALFFIFRLILLYFVYPQITDHAAIYNGLYIGLKFDMRYAVFLVLFPALCLLIPFFERLIVRSSFFRSFVCSVQTLVFFLMLLVYVVDICVYFYLNQRVDLTLLDLLKETDIGFAMVWQSYPVVRISLALLCIITVYYWFWNRIYKNHAPVIIGRKSNFTYTRKSGTISLTYAIFLRFCIWSVRCICPRDMCRRSCQATASPSPPERSGSLQLSRPLQENRIITQFQTVR